MGGHASYRKMHTLLCPTRSVTASRVRARIAGAARYASAARVCVRACVTAGPYRRTHQRGDGVIPGATPDESAIANVYAAPSPARATDRPNERPTDQPDRTRERRLRLHSKRRTDAGVGRAPTDPRSVSLALANGAEHSLPSVSSAISPGEQLVESRRRGSRQLHASLARRHHCTDRTVVVASPRDRGVRLYSFDIRQYPMPSCERPSGIEAYL